MMLSKARPKLSPTERHELVNQGFVNREKRGGATFLIPADRAWAWAGTASDVVLLKSRSTVGAEVLEALLHRLLPFLARKGVPLAGLFPGKSTKRKKLVAPAKRNAPVETSSANPKKLATRIEATCLTLAGGARKTRVRLSELRQSLSDVTRSVLDRTLLEMQDAKKLVLYRDDNTAALTDEDRWAALSVGDAPRHLVYLEA